MNKYKIGLLFGSFNPIHNGHLAIANACIDNNYVDHVKFVVANQNPFKEKYEIDFWDRSNLIEDAIADNVNFTVSHIEKHLNDLNKSTKTYDVINLLKHRCNKYEYDIEFEFIIICGDDVYDNIKKWYKGEELLKENKFIVFTRDYKSIKYTNNLIAYINIAGFEKCSSFNIRNKIKNKQDISGLVPEIIKDKIIKIYY